MYPDIHFLSEAVRPSEESGTDELQNPPTPQTSKTYSDPFRSMPRRGVTARRDPRRWLPARRAWVGPDGRGEPERGLHPRARPVPPEDFWTSQR